jgi:hypothetical protein
MIDLATNADVDCADGTAGRSTYVIGNPVTRRLTHLVVRSYRPPFREHLVPVDRVVETTTGRIKLKCTRDDLSRMEPFEYEEYVPTELPGYMCWPDVPPVPGYTTEAVTTFVPVKRQNLPQGGLALCRGARVEATDGFVGRVQELLVNSNNMQVAYLVLLERHVLKKKEITVPVSQVERVHDNTVYLKLDRQSVQQLPAPPMRRRPPDKDENVRLGTGVHSPLRFFSKGNISVLDSKRRKKDGQDARGRIR